VLDESKLYEVSNQRKQEEIMLTSMFKSRPSPLPAIALIIVSFLLLSNVLPPAQAAGGDLDLTFGSGGVVSTDFSGRRDEAVAVGLQPDGKILVAGIAQTGDELSMTDFAVARYNPDGSLDPSFGSGGKVVTDFSGSVDEAQGIAIQTDGKIVVAGAAFSPGFGFNIGVVRYNTNGSLDSSFGTGGKVATPVDLGCIAAAVAIQADGKILAVGNVALPGGTNDFLIVRYNSDGSVDPSFGTDGAVKTDFFGIKARDFITSLVVQPDGGIVAAGVAENTSEPFTFDFAIARYDSNGDLDLAFGTGGKVSVEFVSDAMDECDGVALQSDGKIVAAGRVVNETFTVIDFALARLNADGSLDAAFGSGGKVTTDFFGSSDVALDVAIQSDGKIVAGGAVGTVTGGDQGLARYNNDGSLDNTFGTGGKATGNFGASDDCRALALQPDGKIVGAGVLSDFALQSHDFLVMRYDGGSFDICLQDDINGNLLQFNSTTGDYKFSSCRKGFMLTGRGAVTIRSCKVELKDVQRDRNISVVANTCTHLGTASIRDLTRNQTFTISDRDITNTTCSCR
jgi:uncharacterized delta-60 repeat protein